MKKIFSTPIRFIISASTLSVVLFLCIDNPTADNTKAFPRSIAQKNQEDKTSDVNHLNFVLESETVTSGVVHIKTLFQKSADDFSDFGNSA